MKRVFVCVLSVFWAVSCGGNNAIDSGDVVTTRLEVAAEDLSTRAAAEICARLDDCCAAEDYEWFLGAYISDERNMDLVESLGANPKWSQKTCASFLKPAMENTWVGSWLAAFEEGLLEYDQASVSECILNLRKTDCGEPLREALLDPECFGYFPPNGGEEQRTIFQRSAQSGETCAPIADGFGGLYYGSCDPATSFCCIETEYGCDPFPTADERGTCISASPLGEECNSIPMQLCVTGAECIDGVCIEFSYEELSVGSTCYNTETLELLGYCKDSWCDMFGSAACEPMAMAGEQCAADWECGTNWCDLEAAMCIEHPICTNND